MKDDTKTTMTDNSKEAFIYLWRDSLNKKWYLGKHKGSPDDEYTHSSNVMPKFKKRNTPAHMKRKILAFGTHAEIKLLEHLLLKSRMKSTPKWNQYYNERVPGAADNKKEKNKLATVTDDDLVKLFDHITKKEKGTVYRIIVALSFYAGLKAEEMQRLLISDIYDIKNHTARTEIDIAGDVLPTSKILRNEIEKFIKSIDINKNKYVCISQKGKFSSQTIQSLFRLWFNELGMNDYSSHSGRNTFIYKLISNHISLDTVKKLTRHKHTITLTEYVNRLDQKDLSDVLDLIWNQ
jgi:integrase/recombinase XerD